MLAAKRLQNGGMYANSDDSNSSGWVKKIVNSFRSPAIKKQTIVHPCVINNERTLVYEKGLKDNDPFSYRQVVNFANRNGFKLKEDQRSDFIEGIKRVKDRGRANIMPIMVLGASLLTQNAFAKSLETQPLAEISAQIEVDTEFTLGRSYSSQEQLIKNLLTWINGYTSYSYSSMEMPHIKRVSAREMAEVAFGKNLPKSLNLKTFQIYGLYNFKERMVYLHDSIDLETEKGKAILLHELVHFLQYEYGQDKEVNCKNELESLAYMLEAKYLYDHHEHADFDEEHIRKIGTCRGV